MLVMLEQGVISIGKGEREVFHPVKGLPETYSPVIYRW